jgi:hypothetical protein
VIWLLLVIVPSLLPVAGRAGGTRDLADAWLLAHEDWARLLAPPAAPPAVGATGAAATADTGAARSRRWWLQAAQGRLFGLDLLPQTGLAGGWRAGGAALAVAWERLGADLYREDLVRGSVLVGRPWILGAELRWRRLRLAGVPESARTEVVLRAAAPLPADLRLEAWWPLGEAPPWFGRTGLRRWLRLRGPGTQVAWAVVVDRRADGVPVVQGEVVLAAGRAALGLRLEPWSGAVGLVTGWRWGPVILRGSHLVHPDLGASHRWGLLLGGGP